MYAVYPFTEEGKICPHVGCGKRLYHRKWTSDLKKLEKRWAAKERGQRELSETADFLDLGDDFTRKDIANPNSVDGFDEIF